MRQVTRAVIEAAKGRLKVVGRAGVGVDNVDLTAATEVRSWLTNACALESSWYAVVMDVGLLLRGAKLCNSVTPHIIGCLCTTQGFVMDDMQQHATKPSRYTFVACACY